ncbi:Holliday junction resolvase RuvX [bacterium 3DAC]|jgi:putative Holliday junction resolvase|nr:Holliday junction resolvase RuvX [Dictyoglomota bacterium]UZN23202.1 Holliday junction resolvase RuvX [bacterium 3DAC]
MANILAIDYGEKRVGIAIAKGGFTFPRPHLDRKSSSFWKDLIDLIKKEKVDKVIVGYPITLKGLHGRVATLVDEFVDTLKTQLPKDVEVILLDERFTSKIAKDMLLDMYGNKYSVDSLAALELLRGYLSSEGKD